MFLTVCERYISLPFAWYKIGNQKKKKWNAFLSYWASWPAVSSGASLSFHSWVGCVLHPLRMSQLRPSLPEHAAGAEGWCHVHHTHCFTSTVVPRSRWAFGNGCGPQPEQVQGSHALFQSQWISVEPRQIRGQICSGVSGYVGLHAVLREVEGYRCVSSVSWVFSNPQHLRV